MCPVLFRACADGSPRLVLSSRVCFSPSAPRRPVRGPRLRRTTHRCCSPLRKRPPSRPWLPRRVHSPSRRSSVHTRSSAWRRSSLRRCCVMRSCSVAVRPTRHSCRASFDCADLRTLATSSPSRRRPISGPARNRREESGNEQIVAAALSGRTYERGATTSSSPPQARWCITAFVAGTSIYLYAS